ncbi:MAG TPA: peptidylprolyl isomerase [Rhodanobacteraceae bacterium]|nr:peptidylprolyl isomerase [Rhodanobacteraceae bacterium]
MQVVADKVVSIHYSVRDESGENHDSSHERGQPFDVLIGHENIIEGLEKALLGRCAGDRFSVVVPPQEAYGERREGLTQRVPKKYFRDAGHLKPGMSTMLEMRDGGRRMVTVQKVGASVIDVDLNPPLAGHTLHFEVEVVGIRDATPEEIAHRHVHPEGGHAH